ncbi:MAG: shikimate kinase [Ornithinimicrobium sp.]|uniref:shikimate kinase n=1 Tax=Ornithinimicrobium sp. TaxID=1977084 RepID=UPI0026DF2D94|nr:shikimate kinase [Ornithinimicrobium sp.]MDO5739480.1 shikimate kinase [Ornithinimicrobium sp.]
MNAIVLIGPPGSGKTTVGALLARRLGVDHLDIDAVIESRTGRTIPDIFVQDGEVAFRALEREETLRALGAAGGVLSLGGGAVMQEEIAQALRGGDDRVVFLDVSIADASRRVGFDASRPLLLVNPRASWTRLMNARRPTYEGLSTFVVDTAGRAPDEIVDDVMARLGEGALS